MAKVNDLARVTSIDSLDFPTPGTLVTLQLLSTGEVVVWHMSTLVASTAFRAAPFMVGSELAVDASRKEDRLQRVRYSCGGRQFRGVAWHDRHWTR